MIADVPFSSTDASLIWVNPTAPGGAAASAPPKPSNTYATPGGFNLAVTGSGYAGGLFGRTTQGFVTMSDALLRSIDSRLQKVVEEVGVMKLQMNTIESTVKVVEKDVKALPTWKGVAGAASAAVALVGGAIGWLSSGGAKTLAKFFE